MDRDSNLGGGAGTFLFLECVADLLIYFLALQTSKNLGLLYNRCPFFFIICPLAPSLLSSLANHSLHRHSQFSSTFWHIFKNFLSCLCLIHSHHMPQPVQTSTFSLHSLFLKNKRRLRDHLAVRLSLYPPLIFVGWLMKSPSCLCTCVPPIFSFSMRSLSYQRKTICSSQNFL
jgi:hypothetical protein